MPLEKCWLFGFSNFRAAETFQHMDPTGSFYITQLWPLLNHHDGEPKYTACGGVYCARLLARLGERMWDGHPAGMYNGEYGHFQRQMVYLRAPANPPQAQKWALYALAKHAQRYFKG
jgi:hypothetical protein